MKTAIILHGKANKAKYFDPTFDSPSNACWLPWIQKQLLMNDIVAQTPEIPFPWKPEYALWQQEFERFDITPETILVGHSCGAGFLVRWLSEHSEVRVGKVILIAPWIDPDRTGDTGNFFDFTFDPQLSTRTEKMIVYNSNDDFPNAQISAKMITDAIPGAVLRNFEKYGHFTEITEFLDLREELLTTD
jgi:predicted alpha/beta hydrolase family esterase